MRHEIKNESLTVAVEERGAELCSVKDCDGGEYIWQGDAAFWADHAPVLFPFCGRPWGGYCTVGGERCDPEIHGFFRRLPTEVTKQTETELTLTQQATAETLAGYPFPYRFDMTYALNGRTLTIRATVTNQGTRTMPFALGLHPGFTMPFAGGKRGDYTVRFVGADGELERVNFDENEWFPIGGTRKQPLRDGEYLDPTDDFFAVGSAFFDGMPKTVELVKRGTDRRVTMHLPDFRYFGLWRAPSAPFLCLEPWTSMPPLAGKVCELDEKPDLVRLQPGESRDFTCTVEFH